MIIWLQQLGMQILLWLLALVDSIFGVFAALSGIEEVNVNAGDGHMSLSSYFLSLDGVQKAFWIIVIASVAICGICTIAAIVKNVVGKSGESKSHIRTVGQALSTVFVTLFMASFLIVGVGVADGLLRVVNNEINGGETQTMSANIIDVSLGRGIRYDYDNIQGLNEIDADGNTIFVSYLYKFEIGQDGSPAYFTEVDGYEEYRLIKYIDPITKTAFDDWKKIYDQQSDGTYKIRDLSVLEIDYAESGWINGNDKNSLNKDIGEESTRTIFGTYTKTLGLFPDCWRGDGKIEPDSFNFLVAFLCTIILAIALISSTFGLVKRLFDIVLLFIALPGIAATIPLDDGAKFKLWRETVISKVFLAFGSVLAVNVFFIVAPSLWNVSLPNVGNFTNTLLKVILICGGALTISGGQLLFARLLGTSAEESREMGQSARTLFGGATTMVGLGKAAGRGLFGYRNANGQRVGGLLKGGASVVGTVGGGALNAVGGVIGGQAYKGSAIGRGISATQKALKGFGGSSGWIGRDRTTGGNTLGSAIGGGIGKAGNKVAASKLGQAGAAHGLGNGIVGAVKNPIDRRHAAARQNAKDMLEQGNASLAASRVAAEAAPIRNATRPLNDDFGREVIAGFEGDKPSMLPTLTKYKEKHKE